MTRFFRFILQVALLLGLGFLLWVRYNIRVQEEGGVHPKWECPMCHEQVQVVSDHYIECGKKTGKQFIDDEVLMTTGKYKNVSESDE